MEEYFVYFPFFILRHGSKRPAVQPQAIYSEVPLRSSALWCGFALLGKLAVKDEVLQQLLLQHRRDIGTLGDKHEIAV